MKKISQISKIDKPREKMEKYGPERLSDTELLAILLRTGTKDYDVLSLSRKILRKFKNKEVVGVTVNDLRSMHGLGTAKACEIVACFELGKRLLKDEKRSIILSPEDVWNRMADIRERKKEHFVAFYLDSRSQEIKREVISVGTLDKSLAHPREVFELAIKNNAASVLLAHNHPSGDTEPSNDDIEITKKLIHAGRILNISIVNHVIVTKDSYASIDVNYDQSI